MKTSNTIKELDEQIWKILREGRRIDFKKWTVDETEIIPKLRSLITRIEQSAYETAIERQCAYDCEVMEETVELVKKTTLDQVEERLKEIRKNSMLSFFEEYLIMVDDWNKLKKKILK